MIRNERESFLFKRESDLIYENPLDAQPLASKHV